MTVYWGEIHNHNAIGYGKGSLARSYRLARNTLDVYAFTPHGYWPDPPATDPQLTDYHTAKFDEIDEQFPAVVRAANEHCEPGAFVTFIGYEWHSSAWGDVVVLFPNDTGELYRARNVQDLQTFARERGAMLIPHHVAYPLGRRGYDWNSRDPELSPLVEVFSEHGNGLERDGLFPMHNHSMGGSIASQTVMHQIRRGLHIGFTAGTDNHYGCPATHGEGITGILAPQLTRPCVWEALRSGHTFACTGDRIRPSIACDGAMMGDRLPAATGRTFELNVEPLAPIDTVQLLKNGQPTAAWPGSDGTAAPPGDEMLVRVEWGWGRMNAEELTLWDLSFSVEDGALTEAVPCFCGGAGSAELVNEIVEASETGVRVRSFTCRRNPSPVSGVVLRITGHGGTRLTCEATGEVDGDRGGCRIGSTLSPLAEDDAGDALLERFSSPRIRIGRALSARDLAFHSTWRDPCPAARDTYILKVQQRNGQLVWTSPMLFG